MVGREGLGVVLGHLAPVGQVGLVADQQAGHAAGRVLVDLLDPLGQVVEGLGRGHVVDEQNAVHVPVAGDEDRAETLLAARIPNLWGKRKSATTKTCYARTTLGRWIGRGTVLESRSHLQLEGPSVDVDHVSPDVHADGRDERVGRGEIEQLLEQARLPHPGVADHDELEGGLQGLLPLRPLLVGRRADPLEAHLGDRTSI